MCRPVDVITLNVSMINSGSCEGLSRMENPLLLCMPEQFLLTGREVGVFLLLVTKPFVLLHMTSDVSLRSLQYIKYCTKDTFKKAQK